MGGIFNCIFNFVFEEIHSLPSMFSPLPYVLLDQQKVSMREDTVKCLHTAPLLVNNVDLLLFLTINTNQC